MVAAVPQKIRCKIRGKCCKSGVKWAKVGPAGWKEPLSASALLPCQLLNPLPHTLFNFQLEATPKKSAEEFCQFLSLSHSICPTLRLARIELKFWRHYFCSRVCFELFAPLLKSMRSVFKSLKDGYLCSQIFKTFPTHLMNMRDREIWRIVKNGKNEIPLGILILYVCTR